MAMADTKMIVEGFNHGMSWMMNGLYEKTDDGNWRMVVRDQNSTLVAGVHIIVKKGTEDTDSMFIAQYEHGGKFTHEHVAVSIIITSSCRAVLPFIVVLTYRVNRRQ